MGYNFKRFRSKIISRRLFLGMAPGAIVLAAHPVSAKSQQVQDAIHALRNPDIDRISIRAAREMARIADMLESE